MRIESALIPRFEMKEMKASLLTILALGKRGLMGTEYNTTIMCV